MSEKLEAGKWYRDGNCIYELEHSGWKKGVEKFRNRFSIWVQNDSGKVSAEEIEAISRKIEAIPDLLDALKYARRFLDETEHDTAYIDGVIAKAEGTDVINPRA